MRGEISDSEFDLAFDKASPDITLFISNINEDDVLVSSLINLKIQPADAKQIKRELLYIALGLSRLDEFEDNVLANTEGDEELILFAVDFIRKNIIPEIETIVRTYQVNVQKAISTENTKKTSADILIKEIGIHDSDSNHHGYISNFTPTKKDLLAEIESPTDSINKPNIILPKTKPATADILKGLINAPYNMSDTVKITEGDQTVTIIDPFKKKLADEKAQLSNNTAINKDSTASTPPIQKTVVEPASRIISSNDPALVPESNIFPAKNTTNTINTGLNMKFGAVVKQTPTETFKVNTSIGHDPYREAPLP